jgi:hypothetical protein
VNTRDHRGAGDLDRQSRQPEPALSPGAHVVSPRTGYTHHGIYVGGGRVVHYRGFERGLRIGPIETASVEQFARGRPLRVLEADAPHFEASAIVQRAMSRIGEDRYHVLTNNCEHFCEWCVHAEQRSYQVDRLFRWLAAPIRLARGGRDRAMQVCALLASGLSSLSSGRRINP